jgi:SAM-dependent methyltransferase
MTTTSIASQTIAWLPLAACPDCGGSLSPGDEYAASIICSSCRRKFDAVGKGLNLLPAGVELRHNVAAPTGRKLRSKFVGAIYTRHNHSASVTHALTRILGTLDAAAWGLNLGSADTQLAPRLLSLDIAVSPNVDVVATAGRLPFQDNSLACVVSQEVFEHLTDPSAAAREVLRVLRPGGLFYFQVPFIIGFHSAPHDYWRFTHRGVDQLLSSAGFEVLEVAAAVGAGTSMYRISVEFAATLAASIWHRLYFPAKALAAILCAPLRWADFVTSKHSDTNRIAAGFFAIARKPLGQS